MRTAEDVLRTPQDLGGQLVQLLKSEGGQFTVTLMPSGSTPVLVIQSTDNVDGDADDYNATVVFFPTGEVAKIAGVPYLVSLVAEAVMGGDFYNESCDRWFNFPLGFHNVAALTI